MKRVVTLTFLAFLMAGMGVKAQTCQVILSNYTDNIILNGSAVNSAGTTIPIYNSSFEVYNPLTSTSAGPYNNSGPIPGWTTASGAFGSWQPTTAYYPSLPDGPTIIYSNGGAAPGSVLQNIVPLTWQPNTVYTLTGFVGKQLNYASESWFVELATVSSTGVFGSMLPGANAGGSSTPNGWTPFTVSYNTSSGLPVGQIGIQLSVGGTTGQVAFDNLQLTSTVVPVSSGTLSIGPDTQQASVTISGSGCPSGNYQAQLNNQIKVQDLTNNTQLYSDSPSGGTVVTCVLTNCPSMSNTVPPSPFPPINAGSLTHGHVYSFTSTSWITVNPINQGPLPASQLVTKTLTLTP